MYKKAIVFILILFAGASALAASDVPEAVMAARNSVLRIETESVYAEVSGSGFIISNTENGTYVATNYHVIEENITGITVWVNDNKITASAVGFDEQRDIAILKLSQK
jgi:S1-C subfamily serine protease